MMHTFKVGLVFLVLVLSLSVVQAALITVDGDATDWTDPGIITGTDPNDTGVLDSFDIRYTRSLWDATAGIVFFDVETWGTLASASPGVEIDLMIDADNDTSTGTGFDGVPSGIDYLFRFDLSTGSSLQYGSNIGFGTDNYGFFKWDGTQWALELDGSSPPSGLDVSRGSTTSNYAVEWAIPGTAIGSPSTFAWSVFIDDKNNNPDDSVDKQFGKAPEPATLALFALGLGGLYLKRRRNS